MAHGRACRWAINGLQIYWRTVQLVIIYYITFIDYDYKRDTNVMTERWPSLAKISCCAVIRILQHHCHYLDQARFVIFSSLLVFPLSSKSWHWRFATLGYVSTAYQHTCHHARSILRKHGQRKQKITGCYDFTGCEIITNLNGFLLLLLFCLVPLT